MSFTGERTSAQGGPRPKVTALSLAEHKRTGRKITALTAVDFPTARLADEAGIDLILVGDSLAMTVLGHPNTLAVTVDEMLHHTRAARRGAERALLVADLPFGSYHTGDSSDALRHAVRFLKEAGAEAVKLEGGRDRAALVEALTTNEIPVVGHIGLTPQSLHRMGGYTVQGRSAAAIEGLLADAAALEGAGAIALVLEGIPRELAAEITSRASVPTIGIGAGPDCDGQILVFHDLVDLTFAPGAKFVRRFAQGGAVLAQGVSAYRDAVLAGSFPADAESYHLPRGLREAFATDVAHQPKVAVGA